MGDAAAQNSLARVMEKHGDELWQECYQEAKSVYIKNINITLENCYTITVYFTLIDGTLIHGRSYSIEELAERFPDCEIGWS